MHVWSHIITQGLVYVYTPCKLGVHLKILFPLCVSTCRAAPCAKVRQVLTPPPCGFHVSMAYNNSSLFGVLTSSHPSLRLGEFGVAITPTYTTAASLVSILESTHTRSRSSSKYKGRMDPSTSPTPLNTHIPHT